MAQPFIGEIRMGGWNFNPRGWALCNGQLLDINSNQAMFSLLGTAFGGDGRTTFGLPDLRGRVPIHMGQGAGLTDRRLGSKGGSENVVLTTPQIPAHSHLLQAHNGEGDDTSPTGRYLATAATDFYADAPNAQMGATTNTGGGQQHNNMQPYQVVTFVIALVGLFPSRN